MMRGWPETGFLREYFLTAVEKGKNPVSLVFGAQAKSDTAMPFPYPKIIVALARVPGDRTR